MLSTSPETEVTLFIIGEQMRLDTMTVKYITHFSSAGNEEKWAKH